MKIKIEHQGKLHILGADTSSIEDIKKGVLSRYPSFLNNGMVLGFVKNNAIYEITQWDQVVKEWEKSDGKSLKIQVFERFFQKHSKQQNDLMKISSNKQVQELSHKLLQGSIGNIKKSEIFCEQDVFGEQGKIGSKTDKQEDKINIINKIKKSDDIQLDEQPEVITAEQVVKGGEKQDRKSYFEEMVEEAINFGYKGSKEQLMEILKQMGAKEDMPKQLLNDIISNFI